MLAAGYWGLRRAERLIAERNDRLIHANFELTLAAKASDLGQITSHLIHGMQGPVKKRLPSWRHRGTVLVLT